MEDILTKYAPKDIFHCIAKVQSITGLSIEEILDELESQHRGIGSLMTDFIKSLQTNEHHPSRKLKGISGPNFMVFFPNVVGKRILLLGEKHNVKDICGDLKLRKEGVYEVQKWLIDISDNSPECIDIFTELPYNYLNRAINDGKPVPRLKDSKSPLDAVAAEFKDRKFKGIRSSKMRLHFMDIRQFSEYHPIALFYAHFKRRASSPEETADYIRIQMQYDKVKRYILMYLLGINDDGKNAYHDYLSDLFRLINVAHPPFKEYEKSYFKIINKEIGKMDEIIDKTRFLNILLEIYMKNFDLITGALNIPMDIYCLSRLFIKFDETKMERGPGGCRFFSKPKNVIIYTGANHSRTYESFIKSYFDIDPTFSQKSYGQCLEFNEFDFFA
jgi:hypothetical protein